MRWIVRWVYDVWLTLTTQGDNIVLGVESECEWKYTPYIATGVIGLTVEDRRRGDGSL